MGSAIFTWWTMRKQRGIAGLWSGESGSAAALVQKYGLDAEGVYKSVKEFV